MKINLITIVGIIFVVACVVAIVFTLNTLHTYDDTEEYSRPEYDVQLSDDKINRMSVSEIEAFNANFLSYSGNQTGAQVKALLARLVANAKTYEDEPAKVPTVYFKNGSEKSTVFLQGIEVAYVSDESLYDYIAVCEEILHGIELKHTYHVGVSISEEGLVDGIDIEYNEENNNNDNDNDNDNVINDMSE